MRHTVTLTTEQINFLARLVSDQATAAERRSGRNAEWSLIMSCADALNAPLVTAARKDEPDHYTEGYAAFAHVAPLRRA